jgi:hypothetical protein
MEKSALRLDTVSIPRGNQLCGPTLQLGGSKKFIRRARAQRILDSWGQPFLPPFNQGNTLHSGVIDSSKNGRSQDTAAQLLILRRRSQRGLPEGLSPTASLAKIQF